MSGDLEQEYFADGIVEDIITALSQIKSLFVIARNSSFTYKGRAVDVKQVGRELGVRYILEGSVRKSGRRLRITAQLIDAATGAHLWADRFEGALDDVFDLQDQLTSSVVSAIAPRVEQAEIERTKHKPTGSFDAYDYFLRGMANLYQLNREAYDEALRLFYKAIELDPEFAQAYAMAAWCYAFRRLQGWTTDRPRENAEAERLARRAVELRNDDATVLGWAGYSLAIVVGALADASAFIGQALELNPNLALVWGASGWMKVRIGEQDLAIEHFTRAIRLNPLDPGMVIVQSGTANAHFCAGRYDEAASWAGKALRTNPNALSAVRVAAATNALIGRPEDARKAMDHLLQLDPTRCISNLREATGPHQPEDFARFVDGLRKAGMPE